MGYILNDNIRKKIDKNGVTLEDLYVLYPSRYHTVELANDTLVFGVVMLVDNNGNYTVINMPVKLSFNYSEVSDLKIDGVGYKKLKINNGTKLMVVNKYIPSQGDTYIIFDDWYIKSNNIPFFVNQDILMDIMIKAYSLAGGSLAEDIVGLAIMNSIIARDKDSKYLRISKEEEVKWVGLSNKVLAYKNLTSMIGPGTYLETGINVGLTLESDNPSGLSKMLES